MAKSTKRKAKKNIVKGIVHVKSSFNNTHVTITDPAGNTISWGHRRQSGLQGDS